MLNLVVPTIYFSKLGSELLCCLVVERLVFVSNYHRAQGLGTWRASRQKTASDAINPGGETDAAEGGTDSGYRWPSTGQLGLCSIQVQHHGAVNQI